MANINNILQAQEQRVSEYISNYRSLYKVINLVSDRLQLKLVTGNLYEGIELLNLQATDKALKNSYPSPKELFKKMPLRHLHYINPQSSATMKSITKHLELQKHSIVLDTQASEESWIIQTCSNEEALTASTMRIMAVFQRYIESAKSQILMNTVEEKLKAQMSLNKELSEQISKLSKRFKKIMQSDMTAPEKLDKAITVLESIDNKPEVVEILLQMLNEWIPDGPKTHTELCEEIQSTNDLLVGLNQILDMVRLDRKSVV
jgi:hypothetical protein